MASLSLPRVLQLKKNSLDAEREQFEKFQTLAIQKAINSVETPVKEKHVRSTIIGTFQEQSAVTYWMVAIRLPLQDNRIVAWKFCHVTHKVLREGHPASLDDSQRHIGMIENLGKLWVHLREGYGRLIHLYCNLLVCKLKFHARNPRLPGNMQLTGDELDNIAENDVNNYFQLCVELFDYMEDLLNLQAAVFDSLGNARANSMTASGQCRLAALIPCAQDSSHIYDCNVRLLFRLHASLPADTLCGHRERFRQQFKKLSQFYKHASSLQYYRNLLTLPVLPANPPNFLLQSDFGTYVAPVVSIPEQPPDETDAVGSLIDTSDTISQATTPDFDMPDTRATPSPQPDPVVERDRLIDHLQNELKRMRLEVSQMVQERNTMLGSMREHCTRLENQLQESKTELEEEKQKAVLLSVQTPEIKQKLTETEEKAKLQDEKFQKLKGAYTQLREEHIALIRQKAEVDKLSASLRAAAVQHESAKMALQQQLNDRIKDVELLQQSVSSSEEIEMYKNEIANLRTELEQARQIEVELETLRASMETLQIEHKTATTEQEEKITTISNELKDVKESLETITKERDEKESELIKVKEELVVVRESSGTEYKKVVEQKEAALKRVEELTQQFHQEKEEQNHCINTLHAELEVLEHKLHLSESNVGVECEKINKDMTAKTNELHDLLDVKNLEIKEAIGKLETLETELITAKNVNEEYSKNKSKDISDLQAQLDELIQINDTDRSLIKKLEEEKVKATLTLSEIHNEKSKIEQSLFEKDQEILVLKDKVNKLIEKENNNEIALKLIKSTKNIEVDELKYNLVQKDNEINMLQMQLQETIHDNEKIRRTDENNLETISSLEGKVDERNKEVEELHSKLNDTIAALEKASLNIELQEKEKQYNEKILNDKLRTVTESKNEIISNLKNSVAEKDNQVISLNLEVNKLCAEVSSLEEEFKESQAELEIGKNELLALREEHENIVHRYENNLLLKNQEFRSLNDKVNKLLQEKSELEAEIDKVRNDFALEQKVFESKVMDLEDADAIKTKEFEMVQMERNETVTHLNIKINELKTQNELMKESNNNEIKALKNSLARQEELIREQMNEKDAMIQQSKNRMDEIKTKLSELEVSQIKEKENIDNMINVKDKEIQILEARLSHTEGERLNAECELQDLLQHNNVIETDLAAVRRQLEEAQKELEKERSRLVTCAGEAALEVTNSALATLERSNAQGSSKTAAEQATQALQRLGRTEVKGNEEAVARSAISAAHNAAALSAYVIDVANVSTDMELSDKLTNECRTMLSATKQCLESLKAGNIQASTCEEAQKHLHSVAKVAAAADTKSSGTRSVDDELADMDKAIEQAAKQIEEMLTTSRANDSGVKLEVNGKILDACTTLMGAVKILVQDARRLQNELGDPKTRQKMYRRNPQWSEGLISAAKAVVFAAKLLVTSADEALAGNGRMEAVSAAAQEVAGSTAQLVAASRARAPPAAPALAALTGASRNVATATGAVVAAVRAATALQQDTEALDTSALTLTATRRLEMESKVRSLELETALEAERAKLAALRKRHYQLAQAEEVGTANRVLEYS